MPTNLPYPLEKPPHMPVANYLMALLTAIIRQSKQSELVLTASDILSAEGNALTISPTGDKKGIILRVTLPGTSTFFVEAEGGPSSQPSSPKKVVAPPILAPSQPSRHAVPTDLDLFLLEQEQLARGETDSPTQRRSVEPGSYPFRNVPNQ